MTHGFKILALRYFIPNSPSGLGDVSKASNTVIASEGFTPEG
jgi:hypothetical protein